MGSSEAGATGGMQGAHDFLRNLAVILCVAAVTTILFQRLRQPVVLGYLLAGLIIGPHVPIPLVANPEFAHSLSELGVILLMFTLGLEFNLRKLLRVGPTAGIIAVIQCSLMVWLGYLTGRLFGWTGYESIFTGALIAISSTIIIVKAFNERGIKGRLAHLVFGILIVEDLIAILLLALLTAISQGSGLSAGALATTALRLGLFFSGLTAAGLLAIPSLVRFVVRLHRPETTLVTSIGICFAMALLAQAFGYSVALGAFLGGALVAESGEGKHVEHLIQPVRDMFAAIFFVAVGMLIEPALVTQHWRAVLALTLVVVVGKVVSVSLAAFLSGTAIRTSLQAGMSLAQIGEFSFIIAGVGLALGVVRPFLYPVAVAVSALTTLLTPWLIRAAGPVAAYIDRRLPRRIQTFAALYGAWVERLRSAHRRPVSTSRVRRLARLLLVDGACLAGILILTSFYLETLVAALEARTGLGERVARAGIVLLVGLLCVPFVLGMIRCARRLGIELARMALPSSRMGRMDLARAPRRALVVTLQIVILLVVGVPLLAITQPFLPLLQGALVLVLALVALGVSFWRGTIDLQGHVRAGAQMIVELLSRQARAEDDDGEPDALRELHRVLPGLGEPVALRLKETNRAVGRTLVDLNLSGLTGATILAITRGAGGVLVPGGQEVLRGNDLLVLAGTREAVEAARRLLCGGDECQLEGGPPGVATP